MLRVIVYEPIRSDKLNRAGEAAQRSRNLGSLANQFEAYYRPYPASQVGAICAFFLGQRAAGRVAAASVGECERGRSLRRINDQTCSIPRGPFVRASRGLVCAVP